MVDPDSFSQNTEIVVKDSYLQDDGAATLRFREILRERIATEGALPFSTYMAAALYDPEYGYYTRSHRPITGKNGDFFTSVSVGSLFGQLLAERVKAFMNQQAAGAKIRLVELAAHDGRLAADMMPHLPEDRVDLYLVEKSEFLRWNRMPDVLGVNSFTALKDITNLPISQMPTVIISNELIDAFPVNLYVSKEREWLERKVVWTEGRLNYCDVAVEALPKEVPSPENYRESTLIEHRPSIEAFAASIARVASNSLFITIDYGFEREDLYHPDRLEGTITGYRNHERIADLLENPGSCDLTAHVDFTQLISAFKNVGLNQSKLRGQSGYFTELARPLLLAIEASGKMDSLIVRQLQTLTHPGMMGRSFQVLECSKK